MSAHGIATTKVTAHVLLVRRHGVVPPFELGTAPVAPANDESDPA